MSVEDKVLEDFKYNSEEIKVMYYIIKALEVKGKKSKAIKYFDRAVKIASKTADKQLILLATVAAVRSGLYTTSTGKVP
jgi:hypothetical protein